MLWQNEGIVLRRLCGMRVRGQGGCHTWTHKFLNVSETEMAEAVVPQQQFLLCCRYVLIRFVEHGHGGDTVAMACRAAMLFFDRVLETTLAIVTWSFGEGNR